MEQERCYYNLSGSKRSTVNIRLFGFGVSRFIPFGVIRALLQFYPADYLALTSKTSRTVISTARNNAPPNKPIKKDLDKCSVVLESNVYLSATPISIIPRKTKNGMKLSQEFEVNIINSILCGFQPFLNSVSKQKATST